MRAPIAAATGRPRLVVLTSVFPRPSQPTLGLFVRERMFRVARELPVVVVSPVPWFPGQALLRRLRRHFRPSVGFREVQDGIEVYHPRFFSFPGLFKSWDGYFMALGSYPLCRRLHAEGRLDLLDAHFVYPDGYAAHLIAKWLGLPYTVTARGTEARHIRRPALRKRMRRTLEEASHSFAVAESLKLLLTELGVDGSKITVVGNAVDTKVFYPIDRRLARDQLGLPEDSRVLVSVGGLVERKGFHRVIALLPALLARYPSLHYLIVGGPGPEGDFESRLREQVEEHGLTERVRFLGNLPQAQLKVPLSAADVFVLATRNEGWANVFLEAMACGLPIVTTDVGGNREVVRGPELGIVVPFEDSKMLDAAIADALARRWDREALVRYAKSNDWPSRTRVLVDEFRKLFRENDAGRGQEGERLLRRHSD